MNYNANVGPRQPLGRKLKRVVDVNAMGYSPYNQQPNFTNGSEVNNMPGYSVQEPQEYANPNMQVPPNYNQPNQNPPFNNYNVGNTYPPNTPMPGLNVFAQPMVQAAAMQYTQQLANTGSSMMKKEIDKYIPVSRIKYYFAVDTTYVFTKLRILFFPFTHSDWSVKFEQDEPLQPRYEINAPDLYIPTMAYVTYVLVAGLVLGMQKRFSQEQIGIQSSSALAWCLVELAIYSLTLYVANIKTRLRTLDLLAYSGYKFVGVIIGILFSIIGGSSAYYVMLTYFSLALAFFLVRSLKAQVLSDTAQQGSYYGDTTVGNKRRLYFLVFVAAVQPVLSWWLSFHLLRYVPTTPTPLDSAL